MKKFNLVILIIASLTSQFAFSEVLIIDRINKNHNINLPPRGITKQQVLNDFGEPVNKKAAVGEPPISVWQYELFSVYFERNWVINSVVNKASPEEKGPKFVD